MQNFSSRKRGNFHRRFSLTAITAVALIGIAIGLLFLFRGFFGGIGSYITAPLFSVHSWLTRPVGGPFSFLTSRVALEDRIMELEDSLRALQGSAYTIDSLTSENQELRNLLGVNTDVKRIAAGVIARPPSVPYDALLIDQGAPSGIKEGAVVYYTGDRAIGTVAQVYENAAVVKLFSTPQTKTTVYIVGPNIYTTAHGEGGGVIRVSVPQGIVLSKDDIVLLPGLEGGVVGVISAIESEATNPEQNAYIVHDVPLQSLRLVSVGGEVPPTVSFEEARTHIERIKNTFLLEVPEGVLVDVGTSTATSTSPATSTPQI